MIRKEHRSATPCYYERGTCTSYGAGHNTHTVQATLAGTDPQGWSPAVVGAVDGGTLLVTLVGTGAQLLAWHHRSLRDAVGVDEQVRVQATRSLVDLRSRWVSVVLSVPISAPGPERR